MLDFSTIDKTWTLFLDRDGVINQEKKDAYVLNKNEFIFYDGVKEALKFLSKIFGYIVMVTNQKGIGRKLMTENDLTDIHDYMMEAIASYGGKIDKIYYCTDLEDASLNRKPNHGMALQAKSDYDHIDFSKSIMVGNKLSDMKFGRNAGMHTVFISTTDPHTENPHALIDDRFESLLFFTKACMPHKLN